MHGQKKTSNYADLLSSHGKVVGIGTRHILDNRSVVVTCGVGQEISIFSIVFTPTQVLAKNPIQCMN